VVDGLLRIADAAADMPVDPAAVLPAER